MTGVLGIDLGSSYSAVAHLDIDGNPEIIPDEAGDLLIPSAIGFGQDPPAVGAIAKSAQADGDTEVAAGFTRHLGDPDFVVCFGGREFDATDLCALLLSQLTSQAAAFSGTSAVIAVPAQFSHPQRTATIAAARRAGLDVVRLISEPAAAAIAYGLRASGPQRTIAVYDLGGGTFDVSVVRMSAEEIRVLSTEGDARLGGRDWDERIAAHVREMCAVEIGTDVDARTLMPRAEQLKHTLSARQQGEIRLDVAGRSGRYQLSRDTFEDLTRDLLDRTEQLANRAVESAGLSWAEIDGVLPIGGSTRMPMVRTRIARMSGREPLAGARPDHAVVLGAALDAATHRRGPRLVQDVTAHSLLVHGSDSAESDQLIEKNWPVPATANRSCEFALQDGANVLDLQLTQGDPDAGIALGRYVITGFGPGTGNTIVDIEYGYDRNGIVEVSATDRTTARPLLVTIDAAPRDPRRGSTHGQ